jgi:oligoendopeptidase F
VPHSLYRDILDIIQSELAPHMRRYARLRRRVLGLDHLLYCDVKAPLDPEFNPPMPWHEGCRLVLEALEPMGPEYLAVVRRAVTQRWVDRADNIGKSSGAFCASPYGVHPYILITWSDTMRNVFTLAHEFGHGGHFWLAMKHQRYFDARPAMPFIEAPSIMNEMLLAQHILGRSRERFWGDTVQIDEGARLTWMRRRTTTWRCTPTPTRWAWSRRPRWRCACSRRVRPRWRAGSRC